MARREPRPPRDRRAPLAARVCLLIPTHALPPLDYAVPAPLEVRPGSVVVAPLSGHPRVGVVIGVGHEPREDLAEVREVIGGLELPAVSVEICRRVARRAAVPLAAVLRAALPPGLGADRYRVVAPRAGWPWGEDATVGRNALRRTLGAEGTLRAEREGRVAFDPRPEGPAHVEWVVPAGEADLRRAPKQRRLLEELARHPGGLPLDRLLLRTGVRRATLRELLRRGLAVVERRPAPLPATEARGPARAARNPFSRPVERALERGGSWMWRTPTDEHEAIVAALARAARRRGEQTLVLTPEVRLVEDLATALAERLPAGTRVACYHAGMGRDRVAVHAAARAGEVDVVVGTRAAALLSLARPGAVCVVDEPGAAHAAGPGFEGLPVHAREISLERCAAAGGAGLFLSPTPSLRLYGSKRGVREIPPRAPRRPDDVSLVDMRGTGAAISKEVVRACGGEGSVGVVATRPGYGGAALCVSCGVPRSCPACGSSLLLDPEGILRCRGCGFAANGPLACANCGSERVVSPGLGVERIREGLASALGERVGVRTPEVTEDLRVVVGTAHALLVQRWDTLVLPEIDATLLGSGTNSSERAFRLVFAATERARERLLVQTRVPEDRVLLAALRGDYASFAAAELERLRAMGYPPFGHVVVLTLWGAEIPARRAVESGLHGVRDGELSASDLVRVDADAGAGTPRAWRLLLRSRDLDPVALAGARIARLAAAKRVRTRVEVDPEEV